MATKSLPAGAAVALIALIAGACPVSRQQTALAGLDLLGPRTLPSARRGCPLRLPARLPVRAVVVPILMYHRINVPSPSTLPMTRRLTVHPAVFARQMTWLRRHGYRAVTQRELFDALNCGRPLRQKPIMITFDDGYRDVFFNASPTLARLDMHATAYVISGRTSNGDPSFLSWALLRALERRGIEIGSHTVSHRALTSLSDGAAFEELVSSRRRLERRLGHRVRWLAYPFGAYDARIERLARNAGYVLAVTTESDARQSARRPLALHRLRILDSTGVRGLAGMLAASRDDARKCVRGSCSG